MGASCELTHGPPVSSRGGSAPAAAAPPQVRAAEGAVRESPVAVAVRETPAQPLYPPAESHLLHVVAAALGVGQHFVVQHRGGREIQVSSSLLLALPSSSAASRCVYVEAISAVLFLCRSPHPVSRSASLSGETVAAGVLTCLLVYPLYLLVFTLFRMSRSKVRRPDCCTHHRPDLELSSGFFFACVCVCVWMLVCVCGAGTAAGGPGVGRDR